DKLDQDGYPVRDRDSASIITTFGPAAEFGKLVKAEGIRRGADHIRQFTILGDGAPGSGASRARSSPRPPRSSISTTHASTSTPSPVPSGSCPATAGTHGSPPASRTSATATSTASSAPSAS